MNPEDAVTQEVVTYPIALSGAAGDTTIRTVEAGRRFHVMGLYMRADGTEQVTFKSAANTIGGPVTFADTQELHLPVGTVPHMSGRATGEDFVITTGTGSVLLNGWAQIAEEK